MTSRETWWMVSVSLAATLPNGIPRAIAIVATMVLVLLIGLERATWRPPEPPLQRTILPESLRLDWSKRATLL
jgi:hypothetical protein